MTEVLQFQVAVDEEAAQRYGADYERDIKRSAYSALADKMMEKSSAFETIIHPDAMSGDSYSRYNMRRFYRFSVLVGDADQAELVVQSQKQGRKEAIEALRHLLKQPNDYQGEMRGYFLRWLESMTPEILAYVSATNEPVK